MSDNSNHIKVEHSEETRLSETIRLSLQSGILRCIISNPRIKDGPVKINIRQVMLGGEVMYQATEQQESKVFHHNYTDREAAVYMENMITNSFRQCEILTNDNRITILVSKRGKITINKKNTDIRKINPASMKNPLEHNRSKNYIIKEGVPVPFLIDLGVMNGEGKIVGKMYDKFRQINRFLEFIRDIKDKLPRDREISVIDFGCGKSYLTFAMYYYLHELNGLDVRITGLDLKKDVIEKCNRLSSQYGYDKLLFQLGDIADYAECSQVDMVVTLHACDTATDFALYKAVVWSASVILSVPCCQHELNRQISNELMMPVLSYGILKERFSAMMTDAIRAEVLKLKGYDTEILEFIDIEHTPKNLLIRAVKAKKNGNAEQLYRLIEEFHLRPKIAELLLDDEERM